MAEKVTKAQLLKEYKALAKKADRRLRELEKLSEESDFKDATRFAYARAMKDIEHRFGEGETRFDKRLPKQTKKLGVVAAIKDVERFLNMPSSTKTGIIAGYKKRAETISQKYGVDLSWKDVAQLFEHGRWDQILRNMTSAQVFKQLGKFKASEKKVINKLKRAKTDGNDITKEQIDRQIFKHLKKMRLKMEDLL